MDLINYNNSHFDEISKWFKYYNQDLNAEYLPTTGLIISNFACGFIYLTNSRQAFIEGLCKNPYNNDKENVNKALDLVVEGLFEIAKADNVGLIVSITNNEAVVERCKKLGVQVDTDKYSYLGKYL